MPVTAPHYLTAGRLAVEVHADRPALGPAFRAWREDTLHLSRPELAAATGISERTIEEIELGTKQGLGPGSPEQHPAHITQGFFSLVDFAHQFRPIFAFEPARCWNID